MGNPIRKFNWGLRTKAILLILCVLLPALVIIALAGFHERDSRIEAAEKEMLIVAQSLASQQEENTAAIRQILNTIAEYPEVKKMNVKACNELFARLIAKNPQYTNISLARPDGILIAASQPFAPGSINLKDRKHFRDVLRTRDLSVGEYVVGRLSKAPSLNFTYPVVDADGNLSAVVIVAFKIGGYEEFIKQLKLPKDAAVAISDHRGVRLFRWPEHKDAMPGMPLAENAMAVMNGKADQGVYRQMSSDGIRRVNAFKRLSLRENGPPYCFIAVGTSEAALSEAVNRHMALQFLIMASLACATVAAALLLFRFTILNPVRTLVSAANRIGEGQLNARTELPHTDDELGRLARSFDDMAGELEERERERDKARRDLQRANEELEDRIQERTAELKESEGRFRAIYESSNDAIMLHDEKRFIGCNDRTLEIFGIRERGEFLEMSVYDVSPPTQPDGRDSREAALAHMRAAYADGHERFDWVHRRQNSEEFHAEVLLSSFAYGGETILQSTVRDITERKRSETLYRILTESSVGVVFIVQDGKFRFINKHAIAYTGYLEDLRGRDADFMIHPEDRAMCAAYAREMLNGTRTTAYEYRIVTRENLIRWISQILTPIVHEGRPAILGNALDVTDLKESQTRLEEIQALESSIMSAIPHVVVGLQNDRILFVNDAAEEVFGWKPEELIGNTLDIFCQHKNECRDMMSRLLAETANESSPRSETEIHCLRRDGRNIVCKVTSSRTGKTAGDKTVAIFEDITDKKMSHIQLLQAEKMASIGKLAAGVAHEINNPTAFVSSNLNTLSEYVKDMIGVGGQYKALLSSLRGMNPGDDIPAAIGDRVRQIEEFEARVRIDDIHEDAVALIGESQEGTGRISRIVQDLKNFAHPGEEKETTFNVNENIESTLNIVWNELKYKAVVRKDYGDIPRILGYPQQLNQVFMNLLVNAAQAIPDKGEIRISTKSDGGYIEIGISDTGVGIPPENLPKLFDPFFTTKEVGKGTGLGLHVAYSIIEKHRGTIAVDSTVGTGTTFTVRIPIQYNA